MWQRTVEVANQLTLRWGDPGFPGDPVSSQGSFLEGEGALRRARTSEGGAEREGERESQAGSMPSAEPDAGLGLVNPEIMT